MNVSGFSIAAIALVAAIVGAAGGGAAVAAIDNQQQPVDLAFSKQCTAHSGVAWIVPRGATNGAESEQCLYVVPGTTSLQHPDRDGGGVGILVITQVGCTYHGPTCDQNARFTPVQGADE